MQIKTETKVGIFVIIALAILGYMAVYLGAIKWHLRTYEPYTTNFDDVSGLIKKADVKIAGVKVGWVDKIKLTQGNGLAEVKIMISDNFKLYTDAYAEMNQEGLLGPKFIDLIPGTYKSGEISPGSNLSRSGRSSVGIEDLMHKFNNIAENLNRVTSRLDNEVLPSFQQNMEKISDVFDRDFGTVAGQLTQTLDSLKTVSEKINQGEGLLGKCINDSDIYDNIKSVSHSFKGVSEAYNNVGLVVDSHVESMVRSTSNYAHRDSKGYFDFRLHANENWFYKLQLVGSTKGGVVDRNEIYNTYFDKDGNQLTDSQISSLGNSYAVEPALVKEEKVRRNTIRYSYQVGRSFNNFALRFGAFEDYFGVAADYEVPFETDKVRWVSSLEMFDLRGQNRLDDRRPHFKWLNRVFLLRSMYLTFGVDDFISRKNIAPFFGLGVRFGDDDLKNLLGK